MAPAPIDPLTQASEPPKDVQPPTLYYPKETHFERFVDVQPDGYRRAKTLGSERAVIVIDNGMPSLMQGRCMFRSKWTDIWFEQVRQLPEWDGPSRMHPD